MSKNIVVCVDGTWNNAVSQDTLGTNIDAIYQSLSRELQIKNYYQGVGEHVGSVSRWLHGGTGKGVFRTAREGWRWIAGNHEPGDRIYIFGFSRGAFAARHLAGMVVRHGLRGWMGNIEEEFRAWQISVATPCDLPRENVHFLGLFDCVPGNRLYVWRDRSTHLNGADLESGIYNFRHALAINERRWSFKPIIFADTGNQKTFQQAWFPGFHSDVGGGKNIAEGLASLALWWMVREAYGLGLEFNNIDCRQHGCGHALGVIRRVDPAEEPICSDYLTTKIGIKWDRSLQARGIENKLAPRFEELDTCPRCGEEMFDYFKTEPGQRWLRSNKLVRDGSA